MIKPIVVGETTESLIRLVFDKRAAQESNEDSLNKMSRTMRIKSLQNQVLSFVMRNPNSRFELVVPEYNTEKLVSLKFSNFVEPEDDDDVISHYELRVNDNFSQCQAIQKVEVGKDITIIMAP